MLDTPFIDFGPGAPFGDEPDEDFIITATVAPAAEPLEDGDVLSSIANFATLDTTGNYASSASPTIASVQWLVDGFDQPGTYALSAGQSVVLRVTDGDMPANFREWTIDASVAAIAPAQIGTGDWSLANDGVDVTLTVSTLPDDGGSALTDLEYAVNGGSYTSLGATATGDYTITASEADTVTLRAVNAVGNGTASASKTVPSASSFDPADLFQSGTYTGLFLDFSNMSAMHTDLAGTTAITASGDPIRSVNDLSGTGNRLNSQFTSTSPTYTESGGLAGAFYTAAASERLVRNSGVIGVPSGLSGVNEITVAIAFTSTTQAAVLQADSGGVSSSDDYIQVPGSVGQGNSIRNYSAGLSAANAMVDNTGFSDTTGTAFVVLMEKDGTEGRHYRNGTLVETDTGLNDPWTASFDAAIDVRSNGETLYAVFVINRALTAQERSDLTDWLKAKAGVA